MLQDLHEPRPAHREVDLVAVKGRPGTARIWEVLDGDDPQVVARKLSTRSALQQVLGAFRAQEWDEALGGLASMELHGPDDVIDLYRARIAALRRDPPGPDWDGVMRMTSK